MGISSSLGSSALLPAGLGFRNAVINGGFDVWQRGTSFTNANTGSYTTDRWQYLYDGSGATRIISRGQFQPAVSGATITASLPSDVSLTNFLRWDQTVAGTGATANLFQQPIENVRLLAGKTVTLSFYAKASASLTLPQIDCAQNFGQGGGSSAVITIIKTNESVTTSWQKFSYTFLLPSAAGKTIGSVNDSYTGLRFFLPINTVFTFDITGVQLEANYQPTPFEQRPIGVELALCQRYYQRFNNDSATNSNPLNSGVMVGTSGLAAAGSFIHMVPMRRVITTADISYANINLDDQATFGTAVSSVSVQSSRGTFNNTALFVGTTTNVPSKSPNFICGAATAPSFIAISAEL